MGKRAVFLDRDGTILEERGYLTRLDDMLILPGAAQAIHHLNEAGFLVALVTNQSAVARGLITELALKVLHREMCVLLQDHGAAIDAIYYCPHHPYEGMVPYRQSCPCRKPQPGLLLEAAREHGLNLAECYMVGDTLSDIEAGHHAGCRTILVKTGHGKDVSRRIPEGTLAPGYIARDLAQAVEWIIIRNGQR